MNRQERRKLERKQAKEGQAFRQALTSGKMNGFQEKVIRGAFQDGQIYNNHEWAVRLERIRDVKGVGPKTLDKILRILEAPVTAEERTKARKTYESGVDRVEIGN